MFQIISSGQFEKNSIYDWYLRKDQINFYPSYQRVGGIWDKEIKQYFLDSIINAFDVPKFYIHYFPDKLNPLFIDGKKYAIVDGKQRLDTIFEFMENNISLGDNIIYFKKPEIELKNLTYDDLAEKFPYIKSEFDNYILDVVYIISDEKDRIDELFARLNEGKPLNNAEKRNALGGNVVEVIRELAKHDFFMSKVGFADKRFDYYDIIAKILLLEEKEYLLPLNKKNLDKLVIENRSNVGIFNTMDNVKALLDKLCFIFRNNDPLLETKAVVPIYYWFIRTHNEGRPELLRDFLNQFSSLRAFNRQQKYDIKVPVLIEFDRMNQQGTNSVKSLKTRTEILNRYYEKFLEYGSIDLKTVINTEDLELKEE